MIVQDERNVVSATTVARPVQALKSKKKRMARLNIGQAERAVSVAAGSALAIYGLARRDLRGLLAVGLGAAIAYRGMSGHSNIYRALGLDRSAVHHIHVEQSFLINRPADELYRYWRDMRNLPRIMSHLDRVDILDDTRSHWIAKSLLVPGATIEWYAKIVRDEPNSAIEWRAIEDSDVDNHGEVRFVQGPGDRGTEVHVTIDFKPPVRPLGRWPARIIRKILNMQIREDLRNYKRLMETGEIPTILGQPRGTCTGKGTRE